MVYLNHYFPISFIFVKAKNTISLMQIRPSSITDLPKLMAIYEKAREFMRQSGNATQWTDGYPSEEFITEEIKAGHSFVMEQNDTIVATFCFIIGPDPTYSYIEGGAWLNDEPYGVVHRLASDGTTKGVGDACIQWCEKRVPNLRIDTHQENKTMQKLLIRNGFTECGIIYVRNGTPRIAYQKALSHNG